jgi:peroxiredoxin
VLSSHRGVRSGPPAVGHPARLFSLTSVQGDTVGLATYGGRANVVVWCSRGFTCPFCRVYMDGMTEDYEELQAAGEIIEKKMAAMDPGCPLR